MKIVGFFSTLKIANDAVAELKKSGFNNAFSDLNDHYNSERNVKTNLPGTETAPSLSGLILESDDHVVDRSKAPLTAASPMVSGYGNFEEIADFNCKVFVEAGDSDADAEKARQIIKRMGGELDNPNVETPKNLDNINLI